MTAEPALRLLRLPDVMVRVGLRRTALYSMVAAGTFPQPVRLGARCSAWSESEVVDWIRARLAARKQPSAPAADGRGSGS